MFLTATAAIVRVRAMNLYLKHICLILILLFSAPLLHAGGDTILNGGGQAELNSYTVIDNMKKYVETALEKKNSLQFSAYDIEDLELILRNLEQGSLAYPQFSYLGELKFKTQKKWGSSVTLSYQALYDDENKPRPFFQVAVATLSAYLYQVSKQPESALESCAEKVFGEFQENQQKFLLPLDRSSWRLLVQTVADADGLPYAFISLENKNSEDLTVLLKKNLSKCHKVEFEGFENVSVRTAVNAYNYDVVQIEGSLTARCFGEEGLKKISAQFLMNLCFEKDIWNARKSNSQIFDLKNSL